LEKKLYFLLGDTCSHFVSKFEEHLLKDDSIRTYLRLPTYVQWSFGPLEVKVDKPIIMQTNKMNILGSTSRGENIFQRYVLVSQIKPKWSLNFLIKIVISMNFEVVCLEILKSFVEWSHEHFLSDT